MSNYEKIVSMWKSRKLETTADIDRALDNFKTSFAFQSGRLSDPQITYHDTVSIFEKDSVTEYTGVAGPGARWGKYPPRGPPGPCWAVSGEVPVRQFYQGQQDSRRRIFKQEKGSGLRPHPGPFHIARQRRSFQGIPGSFVQNHHRGCGSGFLRF